MDKRAQDTPYTRALRRAVFFERLKIAFRPMLIFWGLMAVLVIVLKLLP